MPRGIRGGEGGQQQPAAAPEAPDHKGDVAMANAGSAVVNVDEEDKDIL